MTGRPARGAQARADRRLEQAAEQDREGEAREQRHRRQRERGSGAQRARVARAGGEQEGERDDGADGGHVDGPHARRACAAGPAQRERHDRERAERSGGDQCCARRRREAVRERGADGDVGATGDDRHGGDADRQAGHDAGQHCESDSARRNAACCESVAPRWPSRRSSARTSRRNAPAVSPAKASRSTAAAPPTSRTRREAVLPAERASASASSGAVMPNWPFAAVRLASARPSAASRRSISQTCALAGSRAVVHRSCARTAATEATTPGRARWRRAAPAPGGCLRRWAASTIRRRRTARARRASPARRRPDRSRIRPLRVAECRRSGRPRSGQACRPVAVGRSAGARTGRCR